MRISDWSSDVCSSDLDRAVERMGDFTRGAPPQLTQIGAEKLRDILREHEAHLAGKPDAKPAGLAYTDLSDADLTGANPTLARPEARRVGKECVRTFRSRWSQSH